MQTLKSALVIVLLAGVGYGAYVYMHRHNAPPPSDVDTEIPNMAGSSITLGHEVGQPPATEAPSVGPNIPAIRAVPPELIRGSASDSGLPSGPPPTQTSPPVVSAPVSVPVSPPADNAANREALPTAIAAQPQGTQPSAVDAARSVSGAPPLVERNTPAPPATNDSPLPPFHQAWQRSQLLLSQGKLVDAHAELSDYYGRPDLTPEQDKQLTELLGQLAGTIIFDSAHEHSIWPPYAVQPGDSLEKIAAANKVTPTLLMRINGVSDPKAVRPGDKLKLVRGPFDAIVNLPRGEITLVLDGRYAGRFPIRLGRDFTLPDVAEPLPVVDKQPNDLWIGLTAKLGIHREDVSGQSGGQRDSISVPPRDAEDLYALLSMESRVDIRR